MAKIQLKRYNGSGWDSIQPETDWSYVLNKPSLFTPEIHSHDIDDITDLQTALDAKAPHALHRPGGFPAGPAADRH